MFSASQPIPLYKPHLFLHRAAILNPLVPPGIIINHQVISIISHVCLLQYP